MGHGRSNRNIAPKLVIMICSVMSISVAHAEYFGSPTGRTANFLALPQLSIEATFSTGDFASVDYQQMGVRLNYQYMPKILVFGDLGQSELGSENETSIGLGAYYSLEQSILGSDDSAVKVSVHQVDFGRIPGGVSTTIDQVCRPDNPITLLGILDDDLSPQVLLCQPQVNTTRGASSGGAIRNITIELLISGAMSNSILGDTANWYANGGIQMLGGDIESDTVLGVGAGVVLPMKTSEVYAGFDYADETSLGIGYRYFVK